MQRVADRGHHRDDDDQRGERPDAERLRHDQRDVGCKHDEIAMGDIDEPHDAERHRQTDGEQLIDAAEKGALDEDIEPIHCGAAPHSPK